MQLVKDLSHLNAFFNVAIHMHTVKPIAVRLWIYLFFTVTSMSLHYLDVACSSFVSLILT